MPMEHKIWDLGVGRARPWEQDSVQQQLSTFLQNSFKLGSLLKHGGGLVMESGAWVFLVLVSLSSEHSSRMRIVLSRRA